MRFEGASKDGIIYNFYFDDKAKLQELISSDTWAESYPDIAIIEMFKVNFPDFELWKQNNKIQGTGLFQTESVKSYFIFTDIGLKSLYNQHLSSQSKVTELRLHIFVKVIANSKGSIFIDIQKFIKDNSLPKNIKVGLFEDNLIEIVYTTNETEDIDIFVSHNLEHAKQLINCYSYLQKIGLRIISDKLEKVPRKGVSYYFHNVVKMYHGVKYNEIEKLLNCYEYLDLILDQYNRSLCEINPRSKLLMLWSLIEDIFFKGRIEFLNQKFAYQPLLNKSEKKELKQLLNASTIKKDKIIKIKQRVFEIKEKDRNTTIAENIATILSENLEDISDKIKRASRVRGKQAHSTDKSTESISESIMFLQNTIEKLISIIIKDYSE
ncbi:MAG: hypothetical protein KAS53_12510 [Candidatus Cloacimonetes bacterium]|nr:hypothetical protein [Candidatus Cloacimonadota bacterium]